MPEFMRQLFAHGDMLRLGYAGTGGLVQLPPCTLDAALTWLLANGHTPNVYFGASAFDGSGTHRKENCVRTRALFLDLDYGHEGHKRPSPFRCYEDALGYLLTVPARPTCAWHTGHGIQACFKLDTPYAFPVGGGDADSLKRFERVSARLGQMCMSDATYTPEHLFRIPLTINQKDGVPPVTGSLLWWEPTHAHTFDELERLVDRYGLPQHGSETELKIVPEPYRDDVLRVTYDALPEDLRDEIEMRHEERSDTLFRLVARMLRQGYADDVIIEAMGHGVDFREKYPHRLRKQVQTCIAKIQRGTPRVYDSYVPSPIEIKNVPISISLDACAPLPEDVRANLQKYCERAGVPLQDRMLEAARFHEHLFTTQPSGVMETPCGFGKSTWAMAHIATHAGVSNRYLYVAETVEALYRAAECLEGLTATPVGRVHGFNPEQCRTLCGQARTWKQCGRGKRSACTTCEANTRCAYHNRASEEQKPILVMTHSGFIRLLERESSLLDDASILVDESLSHFVTQTFRHTDLRRVQRYFPHVAAHLQHLFPYSTLGSDTTRVRYGLPPGVDTFASRNYVFRDEQETASLKSVYDELRKVIGLAAAPVALFGDKSGGRDLAVETCLQLVNLFHPSTAEDATYACREIHGVPGPDAIQYVIKRSRFRLDTVRPYRRLWILNASAQLSPVPYPDNMPVFTCADFKPDSDKVTLHVVCANPMASRQQDNIALSGVVRMLLPHLRQHQCVFVAVNKDERGLDVVRAQLQRGADDGEGPELIVKSRGRIKGVNDAGRCTLAHLAAMSLFTTIDDSALHAAIALRRTFPDTPVVFSSTGVPNMPGGRFVVPAMREYYALNSLDQIYQAIWRTAVRNGKPVVAIVVMPEPEWLVTLWKTVMPGFRMGEAYRVATKATAQEAATATREMEERFKDVSPEEQARIAAAAGRPLSELTHVQYDFERDEGMTGLRIVNAQPGAEIPKKVIAREFGYTGDQAWKANKTRIMSLIGDFFEAGSTNRVLRRK